MNTTQQQHMSEESEYVAKQQQNIHSIKTLTRGLTLD